MLFDGKPTKIHRFYSRKRFKSWRRSKQQNCPHFFKIIILSWCRKLTHVVCALALMVQFHKQSCLVEVNYLLLVNEFAWVILQVVVVLSELYPKAKTELIVEISRMEKSQINVVLSKPCWNVRWLYLTLKTSFWNFLILKNRRLRTAISAYQNLLSLLTS